MDKSPTKLDENLLGQILRLVVLRNELVRDVEDTLPIRSNQRVPRDRVSLETALNQISF